jgi:hypothetical protein|tara:strand:- start:1158 stop:1811 length:654 start_codon:yes stop_codon:yes gene_type:complete
MDSIKKIKELLKFTKKKTYKINMYAEAILDDARVIATDSEQFEIGAEVYVINDEGAVESLSEGIYNMEDGSKIRIDANSIVVGFGEEEEEVVEEEVVEELSEEKEEGKEEMAEESEAEETDWAKTFEEMKDRVAELEKAVFGEKAAEDTEDLSAEVLGEVMTRMNSIEEKFSALNDTASNEGVNITPASSEENKIDLQPKVRLSRQEKVRELINKYN